MNASLSMIGDRPVLRIERDLAHPPEKAWKAITDPAEMAHWFPARVRTELKVGAAMRFTFDEADEVSDGEIVELDPPKLFAFRWGDSLLRWELTPEGAGCRLVFTHALGGAGPWWGDRRSTARHAAGWDLCLDGLAARLDGRAAEASADGWFRLAERYVEEFGLAEGEVHRRPEDYLIRFERDLVQAMDEVWAALTEGEGRPVEGAAPPLCCTHGYVTTGPVTVAAPPNVLEYTWHDGEAAEGVVRFELMRQDPLGCRLVVTQTVRDADLLASALAAWHTHLELFFAALHGEIRCPWPTERTEELRKRYADRLEG